MDESVWTGLAFAVGVLVAAWVGMLVGGLVARFDVQRLLDNAEEAVDDLGAEFARVTAAADGEILRTCQRLWASERALDVAEATLAVTMRALLASGRENVGLRAQLDEANAAARLALTFYGREAARADAAEQAEVDRALSVRSEDGKLLGLYSRVWGDGR